MPPERICQEALKASSLTIGELDAYTLMSIHVKCTSGSKEKSLSTVSSLALRKPKNARQQAAYNIIWSGLAASQAHTAFSFCKMEV